MSSKFLKKYLLKYQPRIKEIFELSKEEIQKADFNGDYTFGIVLTGGGSKLDGIVKTAFDVFNMPIKKGEPVNDFEIENSDINIFDPRYATAIGLVKFVGQNLNNYNKKSHSTLIDDIKEYLKDLFK